MEFKYIYMVKPREFIRTNENIFKIGKTEQPNFERFKAYPKGSILLFQSICNDCHECEKIIIKKFKKNFIQRTDFGNEYFEGDCNKMMSILCNVILCENMDTLEKLLLNFRELYINEINKINVQCNELKNRLNSQINNYKNELAMLNDMHQIEVNNLQLKIDKLENNSKLQIEIINNLMKKGISKKSAHYYNKFYDDLSKNLNLNYEIIKANFDKPWNFKYLSKNHNITWEIIEANPDKPWNYRYLSENHNITWKIVKDNFNKPWSYLGLSANPNITLEIASLNSKNRWDYEMLEYPRNIIKMKTENYYDLVDIDYVYPKYLHELINMNLNNFE